MAMLFAITAQSQNVLQFTPQSQDVIQFSTDKLATDKVFTEADVTVGAPRTQSNTQGLVLHQAPLNSKLGVELQQYLCSANVKSQRKMAGANSSQTTANSSQTTTNSSQTTANTTPLPLTVNVMVRLMPTAGVTAEVLEAAGCKVNWSMKSQAFVTVPVDKLEALADIHGVLDINLPKTYHLQNANAREVTNVSEVADPVAAVAAGLPQAYDGTGVIVGVIDNGMDFAHPAFRNADGTTRIKRAITYRNADEEQSGQQVNYIRRIHTDQDDIFSVIPATHSSHGSHTMGTAAGSNTGNGMQGMAPGADLVPADLIELDENLLIDAFNNICDYAEEVGKPVAINYSIGEIGSFRDGCEKISQAIIELTEDGTKPGVVISVAAGNDGDNNAFVHHTFTSDDEKLYVMMGVGPVTVDLNSPSGPIRVRPLFVDEKLSGYVNKEVEPFQDIIAAYSLSEQRLLGDDETIGVARLYEEEKEDGSTQSYLTPADNRKELGLNFITLGAFRKMLASEKYYMQATHNCCDGVTKKKFIHFNTTAKMGVGVLEDVRLGGCFSYPAGTELIVSNVTNGLGGNLIKPDGFDYVVEGSPYGTINETACNLANITVGSYNVCNTYNNYFGEEISYNDPLGEVSSFSSYGHTLDGNDFPKPEVLSPGSYLLSAANGNYASYFETYGNPLPKEKITSPIDLAQKLEYDGQNYWYMYMHGTSMATPVVTGIIALWLQADPTLSVRDVREIIAKTAIPYEGDDPVKSSLYGKIDALAGLKYITSEVTGIDCLTYPQTHDAFDALHTPDRIFTLDGRQVKDTTSPGIYVIGGKKIVK